MVLVFVYTLLVGRPISSRKVLNKVLLRKGVHRILLDRLILALPLNQSKLELLVLLLLRKSEQL